MLTTGQWLRKPTCREASSEAHPLLFLYDCQTTGFSIYNEHIIEMAARVVHCLIPCHNNTFSNPVETSGYSPKAGILSFQLNCLVQWQGLPIVLVGHNGLSFNCPILFAEVEHSPSPLPDVSLHVWDQQSSLQRHFTSPQKGKVAS